MKTALKLGILLAVIAFGAYHITINWGLLSKGQSLAIARKWLNEPNWMPNEATRKSIICQCGEQVHTYTFSSDANLNDMDMVRVDRKTGSVLMWASDFSGDYKSEDPKVLVKAFKTWAPSHLPPAFLSKLTKMSRYEWLYRQSNSVWIPSTGVQIEVSKQGQVVTADIFDCRLSDYTGPVIVNSAEAMRTAKRWLADKYAGSRFRVSWMYDTPAVCYGFEDPLSLHTPVPYYSIVGNDLDTIFCESTTVTVNAHTGEVWDNDGRRWEYLPIKPWPPKMLTVRYGVNQVKGYPNSLIPLKTLQLLVKGRSVSANAGEMLFTLDGKRIVLPTKVVANADVLYLPWQSLKSLPGLKCSYNAKLNRLDVKRD
ncbi:MAG: hypothetical protein ACYC1M_08810 [Armatimonadota bacterium]